MFLGDIDFRFSRDLRVGELSMPIIKHDRCPLHAGFIEIRMSKEVTGKAFRNSQNRSGFDEYQSRRVSEAKKNVPLLNKESVSVPERQKKNELCHYNPPPRVSG